MNTSVRYITIDAESAGQRLDNFLIKTLKGVPKSHLYRLLRRGEVRVNKKRVKADYRLQLSDSVRIPPVRAAKEATPARLSNDRLSQLEKAIIYEDDVLLVLNKPAGIAVHGGSGVHCGVIEAMRQLRPKCKTMELVHRLDKATSGCLVIAKKRRVLRELQAIWRDSAVEKNYLALVKGRWQVKNYQVDLPLIKSRPLSGERLAQVSKQGKPSITLFTTLEVFEKTTLLRATLVTGRMHQIRVHAAASGHPIVGDDKYGDKAFNQAQRSQRMCLHAESIRLTLPDTQQPVVLTAPLKQDFICQ